jgi:hypothetical protein
VDAAAVVRGVCHLMLLRAQVTHVWETYTKCGNESNLWEFSGYFIGVREVFVPDVSTQRSCVFLSGRNIQKQCSRNGKFRAFYVDQVRYFKASNVASYSKRKNVLNGYYFNVTRSL